MIGPHSSTSPVIRCWTITWTRLRVVLSHD
jgi:hypothetical protein